MNRVRIPPRFGEMLEIPSPLSNQRSQVWPLTDNFLIGSALPLSWLTQRESGLVWLVNFKYLMHKIRKEWSRLLKKEQNCWVPCLLILATIIIISQTQQTRKETYSYTYPKKRRYIWICFIYFCESCWHMLSDTCFFLWGL